MKKFKEYLERLNNRLENALKGAFVHTGRALLLIGFLLALVVSYSLSSTFKWLNARRSKMSFEKKTALKWAKRVGLGLGTTALLGALATVYVFYGLTVLTSTGLVLAGTIGLYYLLKKWYRRPNLAGWHFNTVTFEVAKAIASIVAGVALAGLLKLLFVILPLHDQLPWYVLIPIAGMVAFMVWKPEQPKEGEEPDMLSVPETKKAAYMLFLGMSLGIYFWTSQYRGTSKLLLERSTKVIEPFTDSEGFLNMGDVQFKVWDNAEAQPGSKERTYISAPTKNRVEVKVQLMFILEPRNPRNALDSVDAALELGDRARQELRELASQVVDTDLPSLHKVLDRVFVGTTLVTCFLGKNVPGYKEGAMVRNRSGEIMCELVENDMTIPDASTKLVERMNKEVEPELLKRVSVKKPDGTMEIGVNTITVTNPIQEVMDAIGYGLKRIIFADIEFSDKVKLAAEAASAEQDERISQLASAATIKAVRKELMPDADEAQNPASELATILAAAQDDKTGNVRVIWTPGGNPFTNAAVVAASEIRSKK